MNSDARVLVVGDAMLDHYWDGSVDRISPEAPVPVLSVSGRRSSPGGAANVAANLAALGMRTTLLTMLGRDDAARHLRAMLESRGIELEAVQEPDYTTTQKIRCVSQHHHLLRADFESEPLPCMVTLLAQRFAALLPDHDLVVLSDYAKGALQECQPLVRDTRRQGKPVLVDPKGRDYTRYGGASLVKPNLAEFTACVGRCDGEDHFRQLGAALRRKLQIDQLLVTRGEKGMTLFDAQGVHDQPAMVREIYDVCGAGDTVLATLAHRLVSGDTTRAALRWASAAASIAVSKFGTSQVSLDELQTMLGNDALNERRC